MILNAFGELIKLGYWFGRDSITFLFKRKIVYVFEESILL